MNSYKFKIPFPRFSQNANKILNKSTNLSNVDVNKKSFLYFLLLFCIIILIVLICITMVYLLYSCDTKKSYLNFITDLSFNPCDSSSIVTNKNDSTIDFIERKLENEKEVFHISNQDYDFNQAQCKCSAYNARLATKEEIINAYNKGADWCSYGWSEGQTAYYPTQKCTWDKLQLGNPKNKWDCGHPGVNGGFFSNPMLKFGVNCYGIKPQGKIIKEKEAICPKKEFCTLKKNYTASNKLTTDEISPFNQNTWSMF